MGVGVRWVVILTPTSHHGKNFGHSSMRRQGYNWGYINGRYRTYSPHRFPRGLVSRRPYGRTIRKPVWSTMWNDFNVEEAQWQKWQQDFPWAFKQPTYNRGELRAMRHREIQRLKSPKMPYWRNYGGDIGLKDVSGSYGPSGRHRMPSHYRTDKRVPEGGLYNTIDKV